MQHLGEGSDAMKKVERWRGSEGGGVERSWEGGQMFNPN